ncbi:MAG: restriction endonuclease subunit S [Haemophilus parainfluenzae]|nr:restriction endonuclease subunit S [Haemophilus parainfluenzae]
MSNWKEYRLGDCIEFIIDNRGKNPPLSNNGYELIETISINSENKYPDYSKISKFVSKDTYNNWFRKGHPKKGDILISTVGANIGRVSIMNENRGCIAQNLIGLRTDKEKLVPDYLYYFLIKKSTQHTLSSLNIGSAQPSIKVPHLLNILINVPNIQRQEEIANILSSLDEKIELNTQINQTLEQIAQALFKSWFVDFDPVRAKVQALSDGLNLEQAELAAMQAISGKTPEELTALLQTHPERYAELAETAKAFPCEMVEVDRVEMPKGWEVKSLPEIIDFLEGPGIRNWQYTDEEDGIKFINIRCIQNGDLTLTTANKITKEEAFGKYKHFQLEEDDIVVSTSGTLGRFAFVRKEHLPLSLNTSVIRFRPIKNKSTLGFIAGFVENQLQHELEIRASGSAQRNFGPTHLKQISLLVPDFKLLELHQKYVSSLFEKRKQLLSEIDLLKDTRDLLLPKLLNGEI